MKFYKAFGALAEQGVTNPLDDRLEALLTDLKQFFRQTDGLGLEPALLHKLAFELLDAKTAEDLPPELLYLLQQAMGGSSGNPPAAPSESFGFLKQLLQFFMSVPEGEARSTPSWRPTRPPSSRASSRRAASEHRHRPAGRHPSACRYRPAPQRPTHCRH